MHQSELKKMTKVSGQFLGRSLAALTFLAAAGNIGAVDSNHTHSQDDVRKTTLGNVESNNPNADKEKQRLSHSEPTMQNCVDFIGMDHALKQYHAHNLSMPVAESDGRVQTLNKKGAMAPVLDQASQSFIEFGKNKKVLEIGGAYGFIMGKMLEQYPNTTYHMNDLDERHVYIAAHNTSNLNLPLQTLANIKFMVGDVAQTETTEKYDAILVARVLHFMNPETLNKTVAKLHTLLNPGGRVYVVAITPYVKRYDLFIPEYEARLQRGDSYPGYVTSLRDWLNAEVTSPSQNAAISAEPFMFLDPRVMQKLFSEHNFKIIVCETKDLGYPSESWSLDGRENVILIAEKSNEDAK